MAAKTKTKLLQRSQPCHKGEFRHASISARYTKWTESSWAFPKSYNANDSWIMHSSDGRQRGDKRAHNSTIKVRPKPLPNTLMHLSRNVGLTLLKPEWIVQCLIQGGK